MQPSALHLGGPSAKTSNAKKDCPCAILSRFRNGRGRHRVFVLGRLARMARNDEQSQTEIRLQRYAIVAPTRFLFKAHGEELLTGGSTLPAFRRKVKQLEVDTITDALGARAWNFWHRLKDRFKMLMRIKSPTQSNVCLSGLAVIRRFDGRDGAQSREVQSAGAPR